MSDEKKAVVCPHCGYEDEELYEELREDGNGSWSLLTECEMCDKPFRLLYSMEYYVETYAFDEKDETDYARQKQRDGGAA